MKSVFGINFNNLIYLFTYYARESSYEEFMSGNHRYSEEKESMYIDRVTGKLVSQTYAVSDPFALQHPGAVVMNYYEVTDEEFQDVLIKYDIKERTKFQTLNKNNWRCWLKENGYVK